MKHLLPLFAAVFVVQHSAFAQATVVTFDSMKVTAGEALPGSNVIVTLSFKVQPGYYLHSNRPTVPRAIATEVRLGTIPAARSLPAAYGTPGQKTIPNITQPASVYAGALTAQVPVVIAPNAFFPIQLAGAIGYAPVNEKTHVAGRVEQVNFTVTIPRSTNQPPANAKSPTPDPKKK